MAVKDLCVVIGLVIVAYLLSFLSDRVLFPDPERVLQEATEVSKKQCF